MQIKISRTQWEQVGEQAGWMGGIETEAKKKKKYEHSPEEHGFIDECIKKNPDKGSGYCPSIVDKAKGTTEWRKGPRK